MRIQAEMEFLAPGGQPLFVYARETPPGAQPATAHFVPHTVEVHDVRGREPLRLDDHGGMLGRWPTRVRRFDEDAHIREHYYPESAAIIETALGAAQVVVFDHNVRRAGAPDPRTVSHGIGQPVHHAHTDYTPRSALRRLRSELGANAESGVSRYLQVNLWRPIRGPVRDAPLALCDGATLSQDALHPVELRYAERSGEIYYLTHEPGQRWYFASDMAVDEAWLFKNFDSAPPGAAHAAPHSAFTDRRHPHAAPRESIEVRALAIFR